MAGFIQTTTFELTDGRVLECVYPVHVTQGYTSGLPEYCYPDESEAGEPEYLLDGVEVSVEDLPKGLATIAEAMYCATSLDKRFAHSQSEVDYCDHQEPDDY